MLPDSHYDKKKAVRAVKFIEMLPHTKGEWEGKPFWLLPWQEQIIRDLFGIVKADGFRQFRTAYIEIPKKQGKSELAAAIALYLLYADHEPSAEVFSAAADRQQASIVFDVAKRMVEMTPGLQKRSKAMSATKRIVNYSNAGYYQVVSADVGGKHGYSISGLVFDEIHNQPNRKLWDVLTKGSGDARRQALHVAITTAGTDRNSICFELHTKALDILSDRKVDPTFYPVVYSLPMDVDWQDEKNWYKVNPSLGYTVPIERMREAYLQSQDNPAEENVFRTLRLCQWVGSTVQWIPDHIYDLGNQPIDNHALRRRYCYAGLDLSSSGDITALVKPTKAKSKDKIDGDTTKLTTAMKQVDKQIRDTQSSLRDVNRLLKMDPGNTDLLAQKQNYLTDAIDATKKKLEEEKSALEQLKNGPQTDDTIRQQEALTREIADTEQ